MIVQSWGITDVGKQRTINEDSLHIDPEAGLFLVLDGMGGHRAGEVASRLAMEAMASFYKQFREESGNNRDIFEDFDQSFTYEANLLRQATFLANRIVLERSLESEDLLGMGSTVAGMVVKDSTASMINVGDSRLYLIRNQMIEQISKDHTLAEDQVERGLMNRDEARESQLRHILSSVIGVDSRIRVHMDELVIFPGDVVVLCTDGLTAVIDDEEILDTFKNPDIDGATLSNLIDEVNQRGGPDNVTVAVARFLEPDSQTAE